MSFLVKTDFRTSIALDTLDGLTGSDDTIWQDICDEAVIEMIGYLNSRYDAKSIFQAVGVNRDKTIMMYCKDIVLYHLFSSYNFREIPQIRITRYAAALQWMKDVTEQRINPEGFPLGTKTLIKSGSNDKRVNQQQ